MSQPAMEPPPGVEANLENPEDVLWTINLVTQSLTLAICSFFVLTRVLQRFRMPGWLLSADEYLTILSWVLMTGYCICGIFLSLYGGGRHMWEVTSDEVTQFLKAGYAATLFYAPMTLSIKLSLLSLIARVFAPYKRKVQGIYALGVILIIYYITSWILKIRICAPISAYWRLETDKCLDQSAIILGDSIVSTITDAIILVLPLPLTWSLQIPNEKKLRVGGMLAVGGLATAFSAWRLHLLRTNGTSQDATILFVQIVLSGNAEAGLALICTCLPAFVAQFRHLQSAVRYGSSSRSRKTNLNNETPTGSGDAGKADYTSSFTFGTSRTKGHFPMVNGAPWSDEVELVSNAQGRSAHDVEGDEVEESSHRGIMRKTEVTHVVTYAIREEEEEEKEEEEEEKKSSRASDRS